MDYTCITLHMLYICSWYIYSRQKMQIRLENERQEVFLMAHSAREQCNSTALHTMWSWGYHTSEDSIWPKGDTHNVNGKVNLGQSWRSKIKTKENQPYMTVHTCNHSTLGSWGRSMANSSPSWLQIKIKRAQDEAQWQRAPEFNH